MNNAAFQYQLAAFLTFLINMMLVVLVAKKKQAASSPLINAFLFYGLAIMVWSLFVPLSTLVSSYRASLLLNQVCHIGAILIPIAFMNFIFVYLKDTSLKIFRLSMYCLAMFFCVVTVILPDVFFGGVRQKLGFNYFPDKSFFYSAWIISFFVVVTVAHIKLFLRSISADGIEKKQLRFFFYANLFGYMGGIGCFFPVYDLAIFPFPYGAYGVVLFSIVTAYAIFKYKFLDVQSVIRRTVIFAGLLAFVFAVFGTATFVVQVVLSRFFGANNTWTYGISLFLIVLGFDPIRNLLINLTDKYLFQKKYDYQKILKDASRGMSKIESLQHLLSLVVHFITMKMRVKNAAVLSRDKKTGDFELTYQRGYERTFLAYHLDDTNPLIDFLVREKEAVDIERIKEFIESGGRKKAKTEEVHEYDFAGIKRTMEEIDASCCVPSFLGHELRNILVLGEKKSGDYYANEDMDVLYTLAQESAIAIENARLYDEAISKTRQLEKINEQLEFSKTLLMKALHETEIANKQLQDTQAQLIHEQKMATLGRLAASVGHEVNNPLTILSMNVSRAILKYRKNPDLRVGEVLDLFQKMEQNIGRIKAVVNTLTGLLRRSEKGKFEPLSLKLILEETLPLVQFQTYLDNLTGTEVEFDIPGNIPLIRGDLERLQEVFLNLFINAYHAMTGRRNRKIRVTAVIDPEDKHRVAINFMDNGSGMTDEIMKKIFNYGFTTKPPGKGSGLGLYMCKYIIELHGGDLRVASKIGEGTTFTICLPIYEEHGTVPGGGDDLRLSASN